MRKILDFLGANLFLLAVVLIGATVFWLSGLAIERWATAPSESWAWGAAAILAITSMYVLGRALHRVVGRFIARPRRDRAPARVPA